MHHMAQQTLPAGVQILSWASALMILAPKQILGALAYSASDTKCSKRDLVSDLCHAHLAPMLASVFIIVVVIMVNCISRNQHHRHDPFCQARLKRVAATQMEICPCLSTDTVLKPSSSQGRTSDQDAL